MKFTLVPMAAEHRRPVVDVFNYYVENSFAAYPEERVSYEFFDVLLENSEEYPRVVAKDEAGNIFGFGMLRRHNPIPTFAGTAEASYFIKPDHTGKGLGSHMLELLLAEAKRKGLVCVLASISSLNEGSIRFHEKHGFVECGRFRGIGKKKGQVFDVVWVQKML